MRFGYPLLGLLIFSCAAQQPSSMVATRPTSKPAAPHPESSAPSQPVEEDFYLAVPGILDALNVARAAQGMEPIRLDRALCAVAQQGTAVFLQHLQYDGKGAEQRTASVLATELDRFHHVYRRVATAVLTTPSPRALATTALQPALDPEMAYVGIAVESVQQEMAVVLIFAE